MRQCASLVDPELWSGPARSKGGNIVYCVFPGIPLLLGGLSLKSWRVMDWWRCWKLGRRDEKLGNRGEVEMREKKRDDGAREGPGYMGRARAPVAASLGAFWQVPLKAEAEAKQWGFPQCLGASCLGRRRGTLLLESGYMEAVAVS